MNIISTASSDLLEYSTRHYVKNALSKNTLKAYRKDMEHYQAWGGTVPATPDTIAMYLSAYAGSLSIATLQRRLVSITKAHSLHHQTDPVKSDLVKLCMRGIRREHGKPQAQVSPVLKEDLTVMLSHTRDSMKGSRDRALLLIGFCGALRRSELVALLLEDVEIASQGIILTIRRSKTDQMGCGRKIGIPRGKGRICPVNSFTEWLTHLNNEEGYVFRAVNKGGAISTTPLSDRAVAETVKFYAQKAGLNPDNYSGHSLRAGLATSAAQHGISSWKIRQQTGHKSETMLARYIRDGDLFTDNAAALF